MNLNKEAMRLKMLIFILISNLVNGQVIEWISFEKAIKAQKENPKKILMDVYTDWCGPCKLMDKKTFQNPYVAAYVGEHYYACLLYTSDAADE